MSDNRTTELLREGLTERGIKWKNVGGTTSGDGITEWLVDGVTCRAAQRVTVGIEHLALYIPVLTPEQAIAATLGSDKPPYDELIRYLENDWHISASWDGLRKFWCVELTEEGVKLRDAAHGTLTAEQVREAVEASTWAETSTIREFNDSSWQAIADELNARAERTCEFKPFRGPISDTDEEGDRKGVCSVCSAYMHEQFRYCPNCGCKVVDA